MWAGFAEDAVTEDADEKSIQTCALEATHHTPALILRPPTSGSHV